MLAITGAYILAGELSKTDNIATALKSYEAVFKPFAETCQIVSPEFLEYLNFKSSSEIETQAMSDFAQKEEFFDLPDYDL